MNPSRSTPPFRVRLLQRVRRLGPGLPALLLLGLAVPASRAATAPKIYVSPTGNDSASGAQTTPKRTFTSALAAVPAGGEIVALNTGNYGGVTINKSVTITVVPGAVAYVSTTGSGNGITVAAGAGDIVVLRGLIFQGGGNASSGNNGGISATGVGTLRVENCMVSNFAYGIKVFCSAATHLVVYGGRIYDVAYGIADYLPTGGVASDAVVSDCKVDDANGEAIDTECTGAGSTVQTTLTHCVLSHSSVGLYALGGGGTIYADGCTITGNGTGVAHPDNGQVISLGDNTFADNATDGVFASTKPAM